MKNKLKNISLVSLLLVYVILNVVIFLTVPDIVKDQFSNPAFWITWSFIFPVNIIITLVVYVYISKGSGIEELTIPPVIYVLLTFNSIYLISGMKTVYLPEELYSWKIALIVNLAITIVYIIALLFVTFGISYIRRNQTYTKKKVLYIRELYTTIDAACSYVDDKVLLNNLKKLSENIRFSDPMTSESLANIEAEIAVLVDSIYEQAIAKNFEGIQSMIDNCDAKIKLRNAKCKILK